MQKKHKFKKVVIVGPGLIGGSIGLGLRENKLAEKIVGIARHKSTIKRAKKNGCIDIGLHDVKKSLKGADLLILAAPVGAIKKSLIRVKNDLEKGCIVFDVGSSKREIVYIAEKILPKDVFFIGTHPMAGSEKAGPEFADKNLFHGALCFITRTKNTNIFALSKVKKIWQCLGARIFEIDPVAHDRIAAYVSHMPHMVSAALIESLPGDFTKFVSTGFKDTTRIAAGDPGMWVDISISNKEALLKAINHFQKRLDVLKKLIKFEKKNVLTRQLAKAKRRREILR